MEITPLYDYAMKGLLIKSSQIYHGRYECYFYSTRGQLIKQWIRDQFGEDDFVYASSEIDSSLGEGCSALVTKEQISWIILRWSR